MARTWTAWVVAASAACAIGSAACQGEDDGGGGGNGAGASSGGGPAARMCADGVCITEFAVVPSGIYALSGITAGPDGDVWFTGGSGVIGHVHPDGTKPIFWMPFAQSILPQHDLDGIVRGADGNLWFTDLASRTTGNREVERIAAVGRVSPSGEVAEFAVDGTASGIAAGPDGRVWVTRSSAGLDYAAVQAASANGVMTTFPMLADIHALLGEITAGPDGNLWFTTEGMGIGRITPDGQITTFAVPDQSGMDAAVVAGIGAGPDGNLWFTTYARPRAGRITPAGEVTMFDLATPEPMGRSIVTGPDGNLWSAGVTGLYRITTSGVATRFVLPTVDGFPERLAIGPDGNVWFTERNSDRIGRVTFQ